MPTWPATISIQRVGTDAMRKPTQVHMHCYLINTRLRACKRRSMWLASKLPRQRPSSFSQRREKGNKSLSHLFDSNPDWGLSRCCYVTSQDPKVGGMGHAPHLSLSCRCIFFFFFVFVRNSWIALHKKVRKPARQTKTTQHRHLFTNQIKVWARKEKSERVNSATLT